METVIPRNDPGSESMTQGQEVKKNTQLPTAENAAGNESGVSDTAGRGTSAGQSAPFAPPANEINIAYSTENRSAKFKNGEGGPAFNPGEYGNNQYQ